MLPIHTASIALSKLDRGFDTDFEDIIFLIRQNLVSLNELERITRDALPYQYSRIINPMDTVVADTLDKEVNR